MKKFAAVTVILGALRLTEGQLCPPGTYRDHVTGRCDPCSDICEHKEITGTVDECLTQCPAYGQTTFTNSTLSVLTSSPQIPICEEGHVYIRSLERCDACHNVCLSLSDGRRTADCEIHCPQEYEGTKPSSMNKDQIIATSVTVLCSAIIIIAAIGLLMLYRRRRARPRYPAVPETPVAPPIQHRHPTVSYVPVSLHVQCEDTETANGSLMCEDGRFPTQEEEKFPRAFPDLPSSARPVHGVNGTYIGNH